MIFLPVGGGSSFGKPAHNFLSHSAASDNFFNEKFDKLLHKNYFQLFLWYFGNYMTHCQGKKDFLMIASFYLCGFLSQGTTLSVLYLYRNSRPLHIHLFVLILNLDYSKNGPSSCINYVQYE